MTSKKKKSVEIKEQTAQPDKRALLFQELIAIAIDISLCNPDDTEELSMLIPRLRSVIKKIRRELQSG